MRIYENILDQLSGTEASAASVLSNRARHPRTSDYFSLYLKIRILKISMRSVNRPSLDKAVEHLYDVLDSMPFIDDYSDVILTNPIDSGNVLYNSDPVYQNDDESFYVEDEVSTSKAYAYVCFAVKPDFRKFTDVANFITYITTVFKSFLGAQPCIEYIFPSESEPGKWKGIDSEFSLVSDNDAPLILDDLLNFWKAYKHNIHRDVSVNPVQIWSAGHYASIIIGNFIPIEYRQQAYTDMYKYLGLYDMLEYKYHGSRLEDVKNYSPRQQSFSFMDNVVSQMMKKKIDLKDIVKRNPGFFKYLTVSPFCFDKERFTVHNILGKTDKEKFENIIFYNRNYLLKPQKIYFNIDCKDYPSTLYMDIYLGVVDVYIGEYNQLCLSYPFDLYEENSAEYFIDWLCKEIKELTSVVVDESTKKTFIKFVENNRLNNK